MQNTVKSHFSFFILHSSFEFCEAKFPLGEPLRAPFGRARVGLFAPSPAQSLRACAGGSAAIPLAKDV
jgi:hypothetical protein